MNASLVKAVEKVTRIIDWKNKTKEITKKNVSNQEKLKRKEVKRKRREWSEEVRLRK